MQFSYLADIQLQNWLHPRVTKTESSGQCISQTQVCLPVRLGIPRALREESGPKCRSETRVPLVLHGYTLSSPTVGGEGKE